MKYPLSRSRAFLMITILSIGFATAGERSGSWPDQLYAPLGGNNGGRYAAVGEGTFMDASYNNGVLLRADWREHVGVDIAATNGTTVYAVANGEILDVYGSGKDMALAILHEVGGTQYVAVYGHVSPSKTKGTVTAKDVIGKIVDYGTPGSKGDHLHFGILALKRTEALKALSAGWGKRPYGTSTSKVLGEGWRDPAPYLRSLPFPKATIELSGYGAIANNDLQPSKSDGTLLETNASKVVVFPIAIRNTGKGDLLVTSVAIKSGSTFKITRSPKSTIKPGSYSVVEVSALSAKKGTYDDDLIVKSNAPNATTYTIRLRAAVK